MKLLLLILLSLSLFANEAFVINFKGPTVEVESQSKKNEFIGIILKNETFNRLRGEVHSNGKTLRRYSIKGGGSTSFQIKHDEYKQLSVINLSPPMDDIKLILGKEKYEIPK